MRGFWRVFAGITTLAIIALLLFGLFNMRAVADWWRLRNYSAPAEIEAIAKADTMTDHAKHIFYVTHPTLIGEADDFRQACPNFEQTIVLGCYHSGFSSSIHIYNVNDDRLSGVVEVTAAHEMLHAAYDRLGQAEKDRVNGLLNSYYSNNLSDKRVMDSIDSYKKTAPSELINEMHSIFGTELVSLTPELETHYRQYFTDRSAVVGFAEKYADEFAGRIDQINEYKQRLVALKQKIDNQEADLTNQQAKIESERRRLDSYRSSGQADEYNAAVDDFNALVSAYNTGVEQLRRDIAEYNRLVAEHNSLAEELSGLYESLDSSHAPQTAP